MISGVSSNSYSSYISSSASATASKKFQEQLLAKLDTDGDGSISKDELSSAASSDSKDGITVSLSEAFSSLDSNEDDSLDADELAAIQMPPPPPPGGEPATDVAESLLSALDIDGDGTINSDELTAGLDSAGSTADSAQVFDALDTNEDGTVSLEELTASLQPQQPPAPQVSAQQASEQLFSTLDADSDGSISAEELTSALSATSGTSASATNKDAASQALSRMVAALTERYDTDGSKPVGKYLDTAA